MSDLLTKIFNHFGTEAQMKKLAEECAEFLEAYLKNDTSRALAEIPDLNIITGQFLQSSAYLQEIAAEKIQRTLERIESKYYDKKNLS